MTKPKLLDFYCKAGGASVGYSRAGFDVYGVDIEYQPHYPFGLFESDAIMALEWLLEGKCLRFKKDGHMRILALDDFAAFHASPPCQFASRLTPPKRRHLHKNLIQPTRHLFESAAKPYVIENVPDARRYLINPIMLCGTMFKMPTHRHRYFETVPEVYPLLPKCARIHLPVVVSGTTRRKTGRLEYSVADVKKAMGIDWMIRKELDEAIPPCYTEYLGKYLLEAVCRS